MRVLMTTIAAAAALMGANAASAQTYTGTGETFTGPRVELQAGYDSVVPRDSDAVGGVAYGVSVGYDHALTPRVIVGGDVAISDSSADTRYGPYRVDARRDIEIGGRLGYRMTDRVLLFGRVAYSNARFGAHVQDRDLGSNIYEGWRVGGGAEYALSNRVYAKAEYRYTNYEAGLERHAALGGVGIRF